MFGRVISKIFKRAPIPAPPPAESDKSETGGGSPFARNNAPAKAQPEPAAPPVSPASKKPAGSAKASTEKAADSVKQQWAAKAGQKLNTGDSIEALCGITKQMTTAEIAEKLAILYKRHNRAASSLDPQMREEAEVMLEAIASAKEKFLAKK